MVNRAAYMTDIRKMEIRNIPYPELGDDEVVVKMEYVGICGSDVHYYEKGRIGSFVVNSDFILGHEGAGTIVSIGKNVTSHKVGDRVALEPGIPCGHCYYCKTGNYHLCPDVRFLATPPYDGCFRNFISYPADMAFTLPSNVSSKEGSLVEPLAVGLHAVEQGDVKLGDSIVILGAGCIGLMTLLASKARGASDITVVDVMDNRLDKAKEMGATHVINAKRDDAVLAVKKLTKNRGVDVAFETAGSDFTARECAHLIRRGGTVVLVGMAAKDSFEYDFSVLMAKEATIKTVFRYKNIYPSAISAIAHGNIDLSKLNPVEYLFDDIANAFEDNINRKSEITKSIIRMN